MPGFYIVLLIIFSTCFFTELDAQLLTYRTISTQDGLASSDIHSVTQDSKGYIWIGTKDGLYRWDSKNFEHFTIADGLPSNEVLYLHEDNKGRIWISCFSPELCYYFNGRIYNRRNTPFLNEIKNYPGVIITEQNNELYYSSKETSLSKYNLITRKTITFDSTRRTPDFIYARHKGKVFAIQEQRDRSLLFAPDAYQVIVTEDSSYYNPYFLYPISGDMLIRMDFKKRKYAFQYGLNPPFYCADYNDKELRTVNYNEGKVLEIYKDRIIQKKDNYIMKVDYPSDRPLLYALNGNLLMRTTQGLLFCRQIPILEYEQTSGVNNNAKFIFTYKKEVYIVNNKYQLINVSRQQQVNQLKSNAINLYNLLDFRNEFYLTTSFNIYHFSNPNKSVNTLDLFPANFKFISPSKRKDHFFTANGIQFGIFLSNVKTGTSVTLLADPQKAMYNVFEDSHSRLWYSTLNKVYYTSEYYNGIKNSKEFILDNTSPISCKSISEDNKGNLFFTTNGGIFVFDGKNKYRIEQANLLSDNECNKVVIDTIHNSFWVATKNGLNQIGYLKENGSLKFKVLSKFFSTDGLGSDNINDLLLDSNRLYIATDKGANILDNVNYRPDTVRIPVYVKLKAINARALKDSFTNIITLGHNQNNLTIGFSALYFLRRDRLKIQAFLYRNGSLVSKNEITGDKIDYYSLNDGDYKLVLSAYDQDYRYNNGRSLPFIFTINPPYYKTWWFIIGTSLLIIVISTGLLLWNLNRRKKRAIQQAELQAKLNESTLKSLQSQMNPHFVFNSLNTIQSFITEKNEEGAIDYLSDFSGLMREILEQSVHTFISLENEIQFLQHYVQLEMTRFKDSFNAVWNIDLEEDDLTDIYIPTMLIQPILENAVKHGVSNLDGIKGHLEITFSLVNENLLRVVVKDNGKAAAPNKKFKGNSIAVQTIKDRLNIYTKNKVKGEYHLAVSETGATAIITIPI